MNRRSVLRWLGLAPVAAPAVVASAQVAATPLTVADRRLGAPGFTFDAETGTLSIRALSIRHPNLPEGYALITSETEARASADAALASRIDGVIARLG